MEIKTRSNNSWEFLEKLIDSSIKPSNFDLIADYLKKNYIKQNVLTIICKKMNLTNKMYIQLIYKKITDLNMFSFDIVFSVTIDSDYPRSIPQIKCLTNFCFPTIHDNRNLIFSIINHNWVSKYENLKSDEDKLFNPVSEIVMKIPQFVKRLTENMNNKILVYYGDYTIDMIYEMNEFLINTEIDFFKIFNYVKPKGKSNSDRKTCKERYAALTDTYFLIFDPVPSSKNLGKLLFWGDIRQVISSKMGSKSNESLCLEWRSNNKIIQFEISFINFSINDFLNKCTRKILRLREQYKIFQDDIIKPQDDIIGIFNDINIANLNVDKILRLIQYKEELLNKQRSINTIRELMSLYQKVVEILSAKGETDFQIYLNKLHVILSDKEIQTELEKENLRNKKTTPKNLFESNSYLKLVGNDNNDGEDY